jgi:hypothetical protein
MTGRPIDYGGDPIARPVDGGSTSTIPPPVPDPLNVDIGEAIGEIIPGDRQIWMVNGQMMLVWQAPVDSDGDGEYDETVPLGYTITGQQLVEMGLVKRVSHIQIDETFTDDEWRTLGGLDAGDAAWLNNPDDHPFEFFVDQMVENSILFPWLLDPEIMANTAAAWLEGRALSEAELANTDFWQSHSDTERAWLTLSTSNPQAARDLLEDNRLMTLDFLEEAGVNNAPQDLVNLLADSFTRGEWSQVKQMNQIALLADPTARGALDRRVTNWLSGKDDFTLDTTQARRADVSKLVDQWLGPVYGKWDNAQLDEWGGTLRNDPDGQTRLEEMLGRQRLAMFPDYKDPSLRYDDIAAPWRGFVSQAWGETADEADPFFADLVRVNNAAEAGKMLRREGLARGNKVVVDRLYGDLVASFGSVARAR